MSRRAAPHIIAADSIEGDGIMDADWLYLIGVTAGMGVFAAVLLYMSIYARGTYK